MDTTQTPGNAPRRNEDIALDLLKFIAGTAGVGRQAAGSAGFTAPTSPKADEQVTQLLDLYGRCLSAVSGKGSAR